MKIVDLREHGIPEALLEIWGRHQGDSLLPIQELAVRRYGLFEGRSLVISSPTSSGKTFVGEIAALKVAFEGKKVLYLVPLKALAEEKYQTFHDRYAAYGVKVVIATRDRREFDAEIERGDFQLAVLVYEKLSQLLVRNRHLLKNVSLVVVDELQMLGDPERGPGLELALTKVLAFEPRPQLLGLSAVLREADEVARWLKAELLFQDKRPVELRRGVLLQGRFRYKTYNTAEEGEEELVGHSEDPAEILFANVKHLAQQGEQILIFLKGKRDVVHCALRLAEVLSLPPAAEALEELGLLEETALKADLKRCLEKGVAFHHADLTREERELVERHYRAGRIRVIACTTTLAVGVNLPASTVFLEAQKWDFDQRTGSAIEVPISWAEYENISGRAGRLGFGEAFGRSLLIALNPFQHDLLWRNYVEGEGGRLEAVLEHRGLADRILDLVASKTCRTEGEICQFLEHTYASFLREGEAFELPFEVEKALKALLAHRLIVKKDDGSLQASTLGEVAAFKGIRASTAAKIAQFLDAARERAVSDLEILHLLGLTEDGKGLYLNMSTAEQWSRTYEKMIAEVVQDSADSLGEDLAQLVNPKLMLTYQEARLLKLALLLADWIQGEDLSALEGKYQCYAGTIKGLAEEIGWLANAAAGIAEVLGCDPVLIKRLSSLADQLTFGVEVSCMELVRLRVRGLGREKVKALARAGFDSRAAIQEADVKELAKVLAEEVALRLKEAIRHAPPAPSPLIEKTAHGSKLWVNAQGRN